MKKVFTLLTLLLCAVTGAWAFDDSYVADARNAAEVTSESSYTGTAFSLAKVGGWTITKDKSTATASDDSELTFDYGCLPNGATSASACYTLTALQGISSLKIYYTMSDSKFTSSDQSKSGNLMYQIGTNDEVTSSTTGNKSNKTAYVETISDISKDDVIKIYSSNNRLVIFAIYATVKPTGPVDPVFSLTESEITVGETSRVQVGTTGDLDGITLTGLTSSNPEIATVNASTGVITALAAGTTTISFTASSAVTGKYNATSTTVNLPLTVNAPILTTNLIDYPTKKTGITISGSCEFGEVKINTNSTTVSGIKFANGYTTNGSLNDNYVTLEVEGGFKAGDVVTIAGAFNNSSNEKTSKVDIFTGEGSELTVLFTTQQFVNGRTSADDPVEETYTLEADYDKLYLGRNGGTSTFVTTLKVSRPPVGVTVPSSGVGTFACAQALDFTSADVEAYVVSAVSASAATLEKVTAVPANTGIILKGTAGAHSIPVAVSADAPATNLLKAAVTATAVGANEVYVLKDGLFHLVNTASTVPAGKAYLLASDVTSPELSLDFDGTGEISTGIENVEAQKGFLDGEFYNLNGQRVAQPTKGLYIVNGRKVIIK